MNKLKNKFDYFEIQLEIQIAKFFVIEKLFRLRSS